ncbi:hypothetical protein HPP92_013076 [Vanilla planifolia]|uniref:Uncharacterized protein n=1 Tax=Vanilla planifolia TaxID=51239 RepID=A0A835UY52_VANPL|nr:hypothetical protein HPP92_013076 [Vanilla planifolia]
MEQRYFVITKSIPGWFYKKSESETRYAVEAILSTLKNESPWRYLRGLYKDDPNLLICNNQVSEVLSQNTETKKQNIVLFLSLLLISLCHGFQPISEIRSAVEALRISESEPSTSSLANTICGNPWTGGSNEINLLGMATKSSSF